MNKQIDIEELRNMFENDFATVNYPLEKLVENRCGAGYSSLYLEGAWLGYKFAAIRAIHVGVPTK